MAIITSRQGLIDYCLQELGSPMLEVNVTEEQLDNKVDDALQVYQEFHDDATLRAYMKYQVTQTDVDNGWIPISPDILYVSKLFPISSTIYGHGGMFDVKYQMFLNDLAWINGWNQGQLSYYVQFKQYLELLDMTLSGQPQVTFSRHQDRLYIHGEWWNGDISVGDYVVAEVQEIVDPENYTSVYNDMFMKNYTTALIKKQWGFNMSKFEGMQLPGGVTISGRQMFDDAVNEINELRERMRLEHELPVDFLIG